MSKRSQRVREKEGDDKEKGEVDWGKNYSTGLCRSTYILIYIQKWIVNINLKLFN